MVNNNPYINALIRCFPQVDIQSFHILGEGMMSIVFEVNNEWAFRFAKNYQGSLDLEKEIKALPYIESTVSLSLPHFDFIGKQENGLYFVGYKKLGGMLLEEHSITTFSKAEVQSLVQSLSLFIKQMQSIPVEAARERGVPAISLKTKILELDQKVKEKVFPRLDEKTSSYVSSRFQAYLNSKDYHDYQPTFIHGDLSPNHFLVDHETKKLTGIIDFGDMCISDPDYELIYILEDCGKEITRDLLSSLGESKVEDRLNKISYFVTFDQLRYIIEGLNRRDRTWIQEGLAELKREMQENRDEC